MRDKRPLHQVGPGQGQLVRPGRKEGAQREGIDGHQRDDDHAEQVIQPGDFDEGVLVIQREPRVFFVVAGLLADHPALIVPHHQVIEGRDGVEEGQQEGPERNQEHADHRVTGQGQDGGEGHDDDGYPHVAKIGPAHVGPAAGVHDALPDDEQQQGGREKERYHTGRQEDGPHEDADECQQQGGDVDAQGRPRLVAPDADEQGDEDGDRQPGELGQELIGHPPVGIAPFGLEQQHSQDEEQGAQDGRQDGPELDGLLVLDPPVGDETDEDRQEGGNQQHHHREDGIAQDILAAERAGDFAAIRLIRDGVHHVPQPKVAFHVLDEALPARQDLDDVHVATDVAVLLRVGVVGLGVVIGLLEPGLGLRAQDAVLQRELDRLSVQCCQSAGIMQAAIQEGRLFGVLFFQRDRRQRERVGREGVRGLPPMHVQERFVQQLVAAEARAGGNPVFVGQEDLLVERSGHARNLLQGEGHVEGELRPLGVQHDGYLVGGFEDPVKGLALRPVVQQQGVGFQRRGIGQPQLLQEAVQGGLEVLLGDYGTGRERQQQGNGQEDGVSEKGTDAHTVKSLEVKADGGIQGESADITILGGEPQGTDNRLAGEFRAGSPELRAREHGFHIMVPHEEASPGRYIILAQEAVSQVQLRHQGEPRGTPESVGEAEERNLVLGVPVRHETAHDHAVPEVHLFRVRRIVTEVEDGLDREVLSDGESGLETAHEAEVGLDGVSPIQEFILLGFGTGAFTLSIQDDVAGPGREAEAQSRIPFISAVGTVIYTIVRMILIIVWKIESLGWLPPVEDIAAVGV